MRRLVVLAIALAIMFGLRGLALETASSLTLAAVGFVVLAAFTIGELGSRFGPPKVTGYIVAGVVLGPQVANILSAEVVDEMRVFNTLALGLIATSAGLELDLVSIRRVWKALTAMVVLKIPLLIALVGGAFMVVETMLPSLGIPEEAMMPVALIVAVLGIGTSPAIALAVVNDGGAKGRLTDLLLAIAVVKDLVVVICLAIALALAKAMLDPTAHLDAHVLTHVAEELGSSMAVGAVLGVLLIAYMRYIKKQMLLMVLLMILCVAELSQTLHLELLLVFIVAGFLVRNFSPYEHDLLDPIERIALPVFVVFFTTAGAGVDLVGTVGLLPLALSLVVARIVAFYIAGRLGGAIGGEGATVIDNAWLTWLPQAGVTLGLVLLAANALPDLSEPLTAIGMALVAIHLLVGPITLGMGLSRAGEMGKAGESSDHGHGHGHSDDAHESHEEPTAEETSEELPAEPTIEEQPEPARTVEDAIRAAPPDAQDTLTQIAEGLTEEVDTLLEGIKERTARATSGVKHLTEASGSVEERLARVCAPPELPHDGWLEQMQRFSDCQLAVVQQLAPTLVISKADPPATHKAREASSGLVTRLQGKLKRLTTSSRQVPIRMMAREALEVRLAEATRESAASWFVMNAKLHEAHANLLPDAPAPNLDRIALRWQTKLERMLREAIVEGMDDLSASLNEFASPLGRPRAPQYSRVEASVRRQLQALEKDHPAWVNAATSSNEHLRLAAIVASLATKTDQLQELWGTEALDKIEAEIVGAVDDALAKVNALKGAGSLDQEDVASSMKKVFPLKSRLAVRRAAQAFRQAVQPDRLTNAFAGLLERLPEELSVTHAPVSRLMDPTDFSGEKLVVTKSLRSLLLDQRVPELCRTMETLTPHVEAAHVHIAEGVEVASYGLSAAQRESDGNTAAEAFDRSIAWLEDYRAAILAAIGDCREGLAEEKQQTLDELRGLLTPRSSVSRVQDNVVELSDRLRTRGRQAQARLAMGIGIASGWVNKRLEDPKYQERAIRLGKVRLDGDDMRAHLQGMLSTKLPASAIANIFSFRPVDDRRQFLAHKPQLERLRAHLAHPDSANPLLALVSGPRGSGRTSLLNVLQLSARKLTVVRPEEAYHERNMGVVAALARELRCDATHKSIQAALAGRRTLVLIDNVERFILPTAQGVADLQSLLLLAASCASEGIQWVMTTELQALRRLDELQSLGGLFHQHVRLTPSGGEELEHMLRGRARLGGFSIEAEAEASRLARLRSTPNDLWFKQLAATTDGNLAGAMAAWRNLADPAGGDRVLRVEAMPPRGIPYFDQLPVRSRAIVAALHTWGPMHSNELHAVTGLLPHEIAGHVSSLAAIGLVQADGRYDLHPALLQSIGAELCRAGLEAREVE